MHCNPAGDWEIGSFQADAGVTGRKLATDNYGPRVPLGVGHLVGRMLLKLIGVGHTWLEKLQLITLKNMMLKK